MFRESGPFMMGRVVLGFVATSRQPPLSSVLSVLSVVILLFSGCASGAGKGLQTIDETQLARVEKGKTTRAEVLEQFGPPSHISVSATEGEVFTYRYRAPAIPAPGSREKAQTAVREFIVHIKEGRVTDYRVSGGPSPVPPLAVAKPVPPRQREVLALPPASSAQAAPVQPATGSVTRQAAAGSPDGDEPSKSARFVIVLDGLDPARLPDLAAIQERYPAAFALELSRKGDATEGRVAFDETSAESAKALLDYLARPPSR